jgi:DNA-binding transcriptional ArsR family regulator
MHAEAFSTLADPTRLRILEVLRAGEKPVNELVAAVDIHQSGVSRHLRILQEAGFVTVRPEGPQRFYALRPERFREIDTWVAQYRRLWEGRLDRFAAALEHKQRARAAKRKETAS